MYYIYITVSLNFVAYVHLGPVFEEDSHFDNISDISFYKRFLNQTPRYDRKTVQSTVPFRSRPVCLEKDRSMALHVRCVSVQMLLQAATLRQTNTATENPPFVDVFPIGKGVFPLLC